MPLAVSRRRLIYAAGSVSLFPFLAPIAARASTGTAVVTTDVLRIRSGPGTTFSIIGQLLRGASVTVLEGPTSDFYHVQQGNLDGWISGAYIDVTLDATNAPPATGTVTSRLNLRIGPGTSYAVMTVMPVGATVTIVSGPAAGWYQVTYQGRSGWASAQYLSIESTPPPGEPTGSGIASVRQSLNLRSGPGTSYPVQLVLPSGATVSILSNPGSGWVQVTYQGITGWANAQYLTIGDGSSRTATIATDALNLRAGGSTSTAVLGQMLYGETVEIASSNGDWYRVNYHGKDGYAFGPYLTFGGPSASMWVPEHQQQHSLSCEYASCEIATAGLGKKVAEDKFIPVVGIDPNPHRGFRGNIDGTFIYGYEDYGVYPKPLVAALPQFGFIGRELVGGKTELISELAAHHPVVVWIDLGYTSSFMYDINGELVLMATKSHVVCAYGYNDEGVLISEPDSSRRKRVIPWSNFMRMWNSMDQYSLAVSLA